MEGLHTYYVAEGELLVHNGEGVCPEGKVKIESGLESKFKAGGLYEDSIKIGEHRIDALAEVEIDGDRLILKDVAIYSNEGDIPNQIGVNEFIKWLDVVKRQAQKQGFKELQIIAKRAEHSTSANPGHIINKIIKLER